MLRMFQGLSCQDKGSCSSSCHKGIACWVIYDVLVAKAHPVANIVSFTPENLSESEANLPNLVAKAHVLY